jgi:transposase
MRRTIAAVTSSRRWFSDLDRRHVVEVLDGRSRQVVERYVRSLPEPDRRAIRVVSIGSV